MISRNGYVTVGLIRNNLFITSPLLFILSTKRFVVITVLNRPGHSIIHMSEKGAMMIRVKEPFILGEGIQKEL